MKDGQNEENLVLYDKLRDHILQNEIAITNETIYMYVIYFALLALGNPWGNWPIILSFVVLIVFQSMINDAYWGVVKASLFIEVFFEQPRRDIHWELFHNYQGYIEIRKKRMYGLEWIIKEWGASILSAVSLIFVFSRFWNCSFVSLSSPEKVQLYSSLILFVFVLITNSRHFGFYKEGNNQVVLRKCIEEYNKQCSQ